LTELSIFCFVTTSIFFFVEFFVETKDPKDDDKNEKKKKDAMRKFQFATCVLFAILSASILSNNTEVLFKLIKEIHIVNDVFFHNVGEYANHLDKVSDFLNIDYNNLDGYSIKELCKILEAFDNGTIPKNNEHYHKVFMQIIKLKGGNLP